MKAGQCLLFSTHTTYKTQGGCAPQHYRKFFSDARSDFCRRLWGHAATEASTVIAMEFAPRRHR
jgi:hypothetical protein